MYMRVVRPPRTRPRLKRRRIIRLSDSAGLGEGGPRGQGSKERWEGRKEKGKGKEKDGGVMEHSTGMLYCGKMRIFMEMPT